MQTYQPSEGGDAAAAMQTYRPSKGGEGLPDAAQRLVVVAGELPPEVRAAALLNQKHAVLAWTQLDPALADRVGNQACWSTFGFFMLVPCFWPHLLLIWPCLWMTKINAENTIKSQYWILTERELKVVIMDHASSCCSSSGNQVKSIPLENITDCGVDSVGKGCLNQSFDALPTIHVDTASSGAAAREAVGIGLSDYATFIRQLLDQRDVVKSGGCGGYGQLHAAAMYNAPATAIATVQPMQRGGAEGGGNSGSSVIDRIKQVQELYDAGVISATEYEKKRQDILADI